MPIWGNEAKIRISMAFCKYPDLMGGIFFGKGQGSDKCNPAEILHILDP